MSPKMKLYSYPGNKNAYKALIAAEYVGVKVEVPPFAMGKDNRTPEFLAKNPHGKVPLLETENGCLFESNAIARYVARLADRGLLGKSPYEQALVEQWIDFSTNEVDAPLVSWVLPVLGVWPYDSRKEDAAKESLKRSLEVLERYLSTRTYLVGDRITLADIITACNLYLGYKHVFGPAYRASIPNITRYFSTLINQPQFKRVVGSFEFTNEAKARPPQK